MSDTAAQLTMRRLAKPSAGHLGEYAVSYAGKVVGGIALTDSNLIVDCWVWWIGSNRCGTASTLDQAQRALKANWANLQARDPG